MDWIASWSSSPALSFGSGAVATMMAEASKRSVRLLRQNNLKEKSGNKTINHKFDRAGHGLVFAID
jgi:hypothetical protein